MGMALEYTNPEPRIDRFIPISASFSIAIYPLVFSAYMRFTNLRFHWSSVIKSSLFGPLDEKP
jgi:hypothetical protein